MNDKNEGTNIRVRFLRNLTSDNKLNYKNILLELLLAFNKFITK